MIPTPDPRPADAAVAPRATLASFGTLLAGILATATDERAGDVLRAQASLALRELYAATCAACGTAAKWRKRRAAGLEAAKAAEVVA